MSLLVCLGGSRRVGDVEDLLYGAIAFSLLYHNNPETLYNNNPETDDMWMIC